MKRLLPLVPAFFCLLGPCALLAETATVVPASKAKPVRSLRGDDRILQMLDRFTFGPRPGDLESVRAMGLEKWFDRQLHPETIPNADLKLRLAQFPAMQETPQSLLYRLPSNAIIRQTLDGKIQLPEDPTLHLLYANEMSRVEARRLEKDKQSQSPQTTASGMSAPATTSATMTPPVAPTSGMNAEPVPFDESRIAPLLALPAEQRLARLTALPQTEFDGFRKALKPAQRAALIADLNPAQRELVAALENPQRVIADELEAQRLTRAIYSDAQLQEVMTDFWLNHFNVYLHKNEETPYYLVSFERDTIRPRALRKFEDLLEATAHSPAMMLYLDNASSMGPDSPAAERAKAREARNPTPKPKAHEGLNENYARELMELHTLGVNGGYTQADVTQVARVLTGWTVDKPQRGGDFKFDASRHEPGEKTVLGKKIQENGEEEGRQLLHLLATRPATARFLCRKLAVRFVSDDPPQKLVDRMTKAYLSSDGDIPTVLKTLFHASEFWAAQSYRAKVKTPIEFVVSAARASNVGIENMQPLANALRDMGMPLYGAVPPTGYKVTAATWVSTGALVNRMNFALSFAANRLPGLVVNWAAPLDANATGIPQPSLASEEQRLESLLVTGGVSESTRAAVLQQFQAQNAQNTSPGKLLLIAGKPLKPAQAANALEKQDQLLAGLLLGSPEFQRR